MKNTIFSKKYNDYVDVFNKKNVDKFFKHDFQNHVIDIEKKTKFFFDSIYNFFLMKLNIFRKQLNEKFVKKFIFYFFFRGNFYFVRKKTKQKFEIMRELSKIQRDNRQK